MIVDWHSDAEGDGKALDFLASFGIKPDRGGVIWVPNNVEITEEIGSALDYLCDEWDYCWERKL